MNTQNPKSLKSLREMLDKPDFRNVKSVYLNIKVKAFIGYFKRLTRREEYYDAVFSRLVEVSGEVFDNSSEEKLRENLTMCGLFFAAETLLKQDPNNYTKTLFIIEKALIEPIAVCGSIQPKPAEPAEKQDEYPF